jgi:hypothetical protein
MDSGMFQKQQMADRIQRAEEQARHMGYEFHVPGVTIGGLKDGKLMVEVEVENRGVAPFYYDWAPEYGLILDGEAVRTVRSGGKLIGLLPGAKPRVWADTLDLSNVKAGTYKLAIRVPNMLRTGHPVKFANKSQDSDAPGWLTLGAIEVP